MRKSKHQAKPQKRRKRCWGTKNTNWGIPRQRTKSTKPTQRQAANQRSKRSQLEKHPGKHQQWAARRQANSEMQGTMGKSPRYRQINQHQSRDTTVTKHVDRAIISKQCPTTCPSIKTTSEKRAVKWKRAAPNLPGKAICTLGSKNGTNSSNRNAGIRNAEINIVLRKYNIRIEGHKLAKQQTKKRKKL